MKVCAEPTRRACSASGRDDRCFSVAKLFFAYGLGNTCTFRWPSARHASCGPARVALRRVYEIIERYRPTLFFSVPTQLRDAAGALRSGSSICRASGSPCPPARRCPGRFRALPARFGVEILDGIGSTEALHIFISNRPGTSVRARAVCSCPATRQRSSTKPASRSLPGEIGDLSSRGDSTARSTGTATSRRRTPSRATGFGPATRTRRTTTASSGSPAASTTCSRSAAVGQPGRGRERAHRARRGRGMRRRRARRR